MFEMNPDILAKKANIAESKNEDTPMHILEKHKKIER